METKKMTVWQWLMHVVHGALIGAGAILPGISGGVLCVLFGIYQPMMALLSHPIKSFKKYYKLFIPIIIGWVIGFFALAKAVELLLNASEVIAICLFVGLILGEIPSLLKDAGSEQGHTKGGWVAMAISIGLVYIVLRFLQTGTNMNIEPNWWWFLFCGAVWGLSLVVPGLSSSSILIFMGLYEPMAAGIGNFDFGVIIPLGIGILASALLLARGVNALFEKHHAIASHAIVGIVIASTLLIIPEFASLAQAGIGIAAAAVGFVIAWAMDLLGGKLKK